MSEPIKLFTSDGCSGFISFFWCKFLNKKTPWEECCIYHDKQYWQGGELRLRKIADKKFRRCVIMSGYFWWGWIMYLGVRIGGLPWIPFPSVRKVSGKWIFAWDGVRWGYGFNYPKYK